MRLPALVLAGTLLLSAGAPAPAPQGVLPHFSLLLERSATGWSAECLAGCTEHWAASFTCSDAKQCGARVDALGIITLGNVRRLDPRFSFTLVGAPSGITADHATGTAWSTLGWGCGKAPCRARITEQGVETLSPR